MAENVDKNTAPTMGGPQQAPLISAPAPDAPTDDLPEAIETPATIIAGTTAIAASSVPDEVNPNKMQDHIYLIVHDTMLAVTNEARNRLDQLKAVTQPPEEAQITAVSPDGFRVTLITRKSTPGALIDAATKMQAWLKAAGYTPDSTPAPY